MKREQIEAIAQRAQEARDGLQLGDSPVPEMTQVLGQLGLAVFVQPFGADGPEGAYLPRPDVKVVLLNGDSYRPRLRFTAAHELGHHVFGDGARLDRETDLMQGSGDKAEQRANVFAAHFLMPRRGIAAHLPVDRSALSGQQVHDLAVKFGVSYEALLYHLMNLGSISAADRLRLAAEKVPAKAQRFFQPRLRLRQLPPDYVNRALQAYAKSRLTLDRLAELLQKDVGELVQELADSELLDPEDAVRYGQQSSKPTVAQ